MSDEKKREKKNGDKKREFERIEAMIATYQSAWLDLIRIGVVLIEQGRDLTGMKETIDGLGEREVKELLLVAAATEARDHVEMSRAAKDN